MIYPWSAVLAIAVAAFSWLLATQANVRNQLIVDGCIDAAIARIGWNLL